MTTIRRGLAALAAVALLCGAPSQAVAAEQWCETDPLVAVRTPGGRLVPVYVTNGAAGIQHLVATQLARIEYSVKPLEGGKSTHVSMTVTVPSGLDGARFETRSVVSTGPLKSGAILASVRGVSGHSMQMEFKLNAP